MPLSEKQKETVLKPRGKFVVRACPGSGKTYSVAARLAHKISNWESKYQGIATLSFTNVAWQEIEKQVLDFGTRTPIDYPHFLGTIDSFINRFIFLPFGHLVMGCKSRPVLVGEPHGSWSGKNYSEGLFDNISYNVNGEYYALNERSMQKDWRNNQHITNAKNRLIKRGYANQTDADYFAMKILETYENATKAIVHRFPVFIIDEAQDTSEIQMKIIDLLIENGLEEIVVVGDPDQAIFEWNEAKPKLFIDKHERWKDNNPPPLNENRRSSQAICDFTFRLSSLEEPSESIDEEVKDFNFKPQIWSYGTQKLSTVVEQFISLCSENNIEINQNNVAVIYRSKDIFNEITGITKVEYNKMPWKDGDKYTKNFAKGRYLYERGDLRAGFKYIEKAIITKEYNLNFCAQKNIEESIEQNGFIQHRRLVHQIIDLLPKTNCTLHEWISKTNELFDDEGLDITLAIKAKNGNITFEEIFDTNNPQLTGINYKLGTIHSVKGETFEAVLVILKNKGIGKYYKTLITENVGIEDNEELRIVYVGVTRPKKLLVLAVPDNNKQSWETKFLNQSVQSKLF
jgi:superfamily I DNA/RNA helicase